MYRTTFAVVTATLLALLAVPASARGASDAADEIRKLEADINGYYAANDLPKYFAYYADDFRGLFPEGPVTLADYKKTWTDFIKSGGSILAFVYTEMDVQVSPGGDAAVASYRASVRTKNPGKDPIDEKYLETDVFFKRAGQWKIVEVHYSAEPEPDKK